MAASVEQRLIIRHPSDPAILVIGDSAVLRLPSVIADDRHTAEVDHINTAVRERFGLVTTVLRSLDHSDANQEPIVRLHELELHGGQPRAVGLRWYERQSQGSSVTGDDARVIGDWFAEARRRSIADGREWEEPGWFDRARAWIERSLRDVGGVALREVVQLRAWPSSSVLLARTARADFYFKALPYSLRHEPVVTAYLAETAPRTIAPIVAVEPERRWLLMRACAGVNLEEVAEPSLWERSATAYARLQVACVARAGTLRALGCPERRLDALAEALASLGSAAAVPGSTAVDGLSPAERERLCLAVPSLRRRCHELNAYGIPPTIEHGDLWPGNFLVDQVSCVIIDWEEVAIGHPFLSLAHFLTGLSIYQPTLSTPDMGQRLQRAYLEPFSSIVPRERLSAALRLALPLSFIDMALRYQRQRPSVVRLHPWMRDLVPQALRQALAEIES